MSTLKALIRADDHIKGPPEAPVTLVEYGDYECAHCGAAHPVIKLVLRHFGNRLRFVYRHFPLTQIHPHAEAAAETAEFAGASGKFWGMHDAIYENQHWLSLPVLLTLAETFGLSQSGLQEALAARQYAPKVRNDLRSEWHPDVLYRRQSVRRIGDRIERGDRFASSIGSRPAVSGSRIVGNV
jgi:protein-disulfide isomerase